MSRSEQGSRGRALPRMLALKVEARSHKPRNVGVLWKLEKARKQTDFLLQSSEGMQPCQTP